MSDIAEIEEHRNRAQSAYDKLPLSGPVTSWCEMYGEDLLDSCTKLLAVLKQRIELINATGDHWLELCRVTHPPIPWEGAIDKAMEAACKEVTRLRARVAELDAREEETRRYADRLAINIKLKHFSDRAPDWQPLPDTLGILTQIDNMTAGIGERVAELEAAQEWRPIESAPKTPNDSTAATELLGWCPDETSPIGGDRRTIWWEPRLRGGCWYSDRDTVEHPTMWTDLPAPPKVAT